MRNENRKSKYRSGNYSNNLDFYLLIRVPWSPQKSKWPPKQNSTSHKQKNEARYNKKWHRSQCTKSTRSVNFYFHRKEHAKLIFDKNSTARVQHGHTYKTMA